MSHAIDVLRQEHASMARLLHLMDRLQLELRDGEEPDIPLLGEIGEYLHGFPDQCHHPKEDLIYNKLGELEPGLREIGADLEYEHQRLGRLTGRFRDGIIAVQQQRKGAVGKLADSLADLARTYRRHMEMEERHLFPMAIRKLSGDDWAEINSALFEEADPLDDASSSAFAELRNAIGAHAAEHDERARLLAGRSDFDTDLAALQTVAQLNELLEPHGFALRKGSAGVGFELCEQDTVLLEIPPCSESRAAWCAYCYVKGRL